MREIAKVYVEVMRGTPLLVMLVGQEREQIIVKRGLVDAQVLTDILRLEYPLVGVVNLVPFGITAQMILVRTFKIVPVNEVVRGDGS